MAEIAGGFLGPVLEVVRWVGAPIQRQFNYLCCFTTNITNLKNEAKKLQDTDGDLQLKVDAAKRDVQIIYSEVNTWLENSKNIKDEADGILKEVRNVEGGCLKLTARFSLSKRAKKTADRLKELRDQCEFDTETIGQPGPPAAMNLDPSAATLYEFESRKKIEEDIMATLREGDVNMMGICGMGGLGKTTMAKKIKNRALGEHVFDEVVMVVVSRPIDKVKIQDEIGGSLGLKLERECSEARVQKLHARLSGTKRILLVLDDVWEELVLEDLGIPSTYKGCTILLTSRNHDVFRAMNVQIFGMKVLSEVDSWIMFRERVGTCVDNTELNSVARKVVNECKGLPLALTTVGAALKDEVDVKEWKNAVGRLEKGDPDIPEFIAKVYNPLKLSYDALDPKYQYVFLLCCVYPEDADIPLEQLTYFCMGLRIATGNVEEARNRIHALTKVLKNRSLLLDSEKGDEYVRMHDVVRDVCVFIAKHEGYIGDNDLTSSLQRYKLHSGFELLQIRNSDEEINFDGITNLYVLSIKRCWQLTSLPFTQRPNNLITLVLDSCWRLETLSVVGELVNLEILICRGCYSVKELPPEIKGLKRLKVLDLTDCPSLQRIGRGIISSLVGLEELKMLMSFKKWEGEDREERENAGLRELEVLTKLRCLEIEIKDVALAAENIRLSSEVDRFTIRFLYQISLRISKFDEYLSNKKMRLKWEGEGASCLGDWIKVQLLRDTECLLLVGNGANEALGLTNLGKKIRYLQLGECESMKKVVTSSMDKGGATVFPSIENLLLFKLPKLEEICDDRISSNSFQNLRELKLNDLPVPKQLWKSSQNDLGKDFLPQLEVLDIFNCGMMETVFLWKGEDGNENTSCHHITKIFPKLKELVLVDLPNLISLCQGIEGIEFPLLKRIKIEYCEKMKGMVWNENNSGGSSSNASIQGLFCPREVSFSELEELKIFGCQSIMSLFTSSMAGNLLNLKALDISGCYEMVEVIKDDEEKGMSGGRQTALLFPKLHTLKLEYLPKLVSFCESKGIESIQFPVLRSMKIRECGKMKGMVANGVTSNENNSGDSSTNAADIIHLFCQSKQVSFGCLKELNTDRNPFCSHTIHVSIFSGLEMLTIYNCVGSLSLFTSSTAVSLVNLKELTVRGCDEMVEVIKDDEEKGMSGDRQRALLFPKLQTLELSNLPNLVVFCEWKCDVELPSLRKVEINNMKNFSFGSLAAPNLESFKTNLKDDLLKVPFISLKELLVEGNEKPLNCYQIHGSVFDRLEVLDIKWYKGSMSLFSSSITGNLVNLTTLTIKFCRKMVKVIEEEEEEKEKVVSGAQRTTILFPKLHKIELSDLPELVRFCEWKCDVELPSLTELVIDDCYNMKSFTLGPLNTPKLESVEINRKDFGGVKDLNGLVQQQYINRTEEKQAEKAEKKKGGEEEQERMGETEEEQNLYFFQPFHVETSEVATQREVAAEWPELSGFTWPKPTLIFHICLLVFSFVLVVALIVLFV